MSDGPTMHEIANYVLGGVALFISSWKALAKRSVDTLDKTLENLTHAVEGLRKDLQDLRLTDTTQAGQIGRLEADVTNLEKRINGQAEAHRAELDKLAPRKLRTK